MATEGVRRRVQSTIAILVSVDDLADDLAHTLRAEVGTSRDRYPKYGIPGHDTRNHKCTTYSFTPQPRIQYPVGHLKGDGGSDRSQTVSATAPPLICATTSTAYAIAAPPTKHTR